VLLFCCIGVCLGDNLRPVIGIVSYPVDTISEQKYGKYYIAASYVKFIESAGGQVVPIKYDASQDELLTIFNQVNGVLFPGGGADTSVASALWNSAEYLVDLALAASDNGDYFPIEGHCLGFELLSNVIAQNNSILERFNSENLSLPLYFYDTYKQSRIFGNVAQNIIDILTQQAVTMNNHQFGVTPYTYSSNVALSSFFRVISWSVDRNNKLFVSTVEAFKYPIYAYQWHPEKPAFEWTFTEGIDHSTDSIMANNYIATYFVSEARKSNHIFISNQAEYSSLIYNYEPVYSAGFDNSFTQIYFFQ